MGTWINIREVINGAKMIRSETETSIQNDILVVLRVREENRMRAEILSKCGDRRNKDWLTVLKRYVAQ